MPEVTIIMPSLNVVKYIRPCIDSVLRQTLQDMEILAVDAGSTDGTAEILKEYASKDERMRVLYSENKSYGGQVNMGLEQARGEYIGILETDDMVAEKMYEILYRTARADRLEYVKCGYVSFVEPEDGLRWEQPGGICIGNRKLLGKILSPQSMPELAVQDYYLWAGIYHRDLLRDVRLSETSGAAFQDIGFIYQVLSTADRALYLEDGLYFYRQTKENSSYSKKGFQYLLYEYANLERLLPWKTGIWRQACYERMLRQIVGRFQKMALGGEYWEDTADILQALQDKMRRAQADGIFTPGRMSKENQEIYNKFLNNPKEIFEDECAALSNKKRKLNDLLRDVGGREVVVFGCGSYGKYVHALLKAYNKGKICAFCDNNRSLWNTTVQGVRVVDPERTVREYPDAQYVIASKRTQEIGEQLLGLGIAANRICTCTPDYDLKFFMM